MNRQHRLGLVVVPVLIALLAGGSATYAGYLARTDSVASIRSVSRWREQLVRVERGDATLPPERVVPLLRQSLDAAEAERGLSNSVFELVQSLGMLIAVAAGLQVYLLLRVQRRLATQAAPALAPETPAA